MKDGLKFNSEDVDPADDVPHVSFSTDGAGRWWRTDYPRQCPEGVFLRGRCQGVEGHKGVHWSFNAVGDLCYDDNDNDPSEGGCSGTIPPDHKTYRTPLEMAPHRYGEHRVTTEVTDADEIARLELGDMKVGESVTRPLDTSKMTPEKLAELERRRDEYPKEARQGKIKVDE